jgi:hypothetical protein
MKIYIEPIHHKEKAHDFFDKKLWVDSSANEKLSENVKELHQFFSTIYGPSVDIDTADYIDQKPKWDWETQRRTRYERKWSFKPGKNVFYVHNDDIEYIRFYYPKTEYRQW